MNCLLKSSNGTCLTLQDHAPHKNFVGMGACDGGSKWEEDLESGKYLENLALPKGSDLMKLDGEGHAKLCKLGNTVWTGKIAGTNAFEMQTVGSDTLLVSAACANMYASPCPTGTHVCLGARSEALTFSQSY